MSAEETAILTGNTTQPRRSARNTSTTTPDESVTVETEPETTGKATQPRRTTRRTHTGATHGQPAQTHTGTGKQTKRKKVSETVHDEIYLDRFGAAIDNMAFCMRSEYWGPEFKAARDFELQQLNQMGTIVKVSHLWCDRQHADDDSTQTFFYHGTTKPRTAPRPRKAPT